MRLNREQIWQLADLWVRSNNVLIRSVSSRYYHHMSFSFEDIQAEALLTAFLVISDLLSEGKELTLTSHNFYFAFLRQCIQLSRGVPLVPYHVDFEKLAIASESRNTDECHDDQRIKNACSVLTKRQRSVTSWILEQQKPATQQMVADHFNVTVRAVRKILNSTIKRFENSGYQRIRSSITTAS